MDREPAVKSDPRRALPRVDDLLESIHRAYPELPLWAATEGVRLVLAAERERLTPRGDGAAPRSSSRPDGAEGVESPRPLSALGAAAARAALELARRRPTRVINATGIVLHTNLGRAPLAAGAGAAAAAAAVDYSDLELDLASGKRGDRLTGVVRKLELLSGAEGAHAVNNNAAAVLLVLDTFARGREVIVSRGELVEIGGSFRVPDIMERAGVRLIEVGTTNRTRLSDYERAIGPDTALLLKVHRSNFELRGFVEEVSIGELAGLGRQRGLPVVDDLGSGTLVDLTSRGFPADTFAPSRVAAGADLVCFSGDKLLGGPQAGLILGRSASVKELRSNPLSRALRLDKLSLAALDWTLGAYLDGRAEGEIPVLRQLLATPEELESRARSLAERLSKATGIAMASGDAAGFEVRPDRGFAGGGSLPGFELDSWVVSLRVPRGSPQHIATRLRGARVPVLARVREGALLFDPRTLRDDEIADLEASLVSSLAASSEG